MDAPRKKVKRPILLMNDVLQSLFVETSSLALVKAKGWLQTLPGVSMVRVAFGLQVLDETKHWLSSCCFGAKSDLIEFHASSTPLLESQLKIACLA